MRDYADPEYGVLSYAWAFQGHIGTNTQLHRKGNNMGAEFQISNPAHVRKRIMERYRKTETEADAITGQVKDFLEANTPEDWRFTESPSSRFFIVDEETRAKFMGLSYRSSEKGREILDFIRKSIGDTRQITNSLRSLVEEYIADVRNPDLPIVHDIRTVYARGEKQGTIGEEKELFHQARLALSHTVPLTSHRIAARPNAVIGKDREILWVRQYLNWVSMDPNSKEYYLFQVLTRKGIDKCRFAIFSYTTNGDLRMVGESKTLRCTGIPASAGLSEGPVSDPVGYQEALSGMKAAVPAGGDKAALRSESYWKGPTCVDRRYIDLDFKERYSKQSPKEDEEPEQESFITAEEALELCFLKEIVGRAREKLHK